MKLVNKCINTDLTYSVDHLICLTDDQSTSRDISSALDYSIIKRENHSTPLKKRPTGGTRAEKVASSQAESSNNSSSSHGSSSSSSDMMSEGEDILNKNITQDDVNREIKNDKSLKQTNISMPKPLTEKKHGKHFVYSIIEPSVHTNHHGSAKSSNYETITTYYRLVKNKRDKHSNYYVEAVPLKKDKHSIPTSYTCHRDFAQERAPQAVQNNQTEFYASNKPILIEKQQKQPPNAIYNRPVNIYNEFPAMNTRNLAPQPLKPSHYQEIRSHTPIQVEAIHRAGFNLAHQGMYSRLNPPVNQSPVYSNNRLDGNINAYTTPSLESQPKMFRQTRLGNVLDDNNLSRPRMPHRDGMNYFLGQNMMNNNNDRKNMPGFNNGLISGGCGEFYGYPNATAGLGINNQMFYGNNVQSNQMLLGYGGNFYSSFKDLGFW